MTTQAVPRLQLHYECIISRGHLIPIVHGQVSFLNFEKCGGLCQDASTEIPSKYRKEAEKVYTQCTEKISNTILKLYIYIYNLESVSSGSRSSAQSKALNTFVTLATRCLLIFPASPLRGQAVPFSLHPTNSVLYLSVDAILESVWLSSSSIALTLETTDKF